MNKKHDPINVFIVEQHNHVLNILYRGIGSKKIPMSNIKLLHFDAHPDLGVSTSSRSTIDNDPARLLEEASIENWILPAVYKQHINHVVWMRPRFCNQLGDRLTQEYAVGFTDDDTMMVSMNDMYYINEGVYTDARNMQSYSLFKLSVGPIHYTHTMCKFCYDINIQLMNADFILDIDLDTFAPVNPFRDKFTNAQQYLITNLYGFPKTDDALEAQKGLNNQPYPFRLKDYRYPAKKCDGQVPTIPLGSIDKNRAEELSQNRRIQLSSLRQYIEEFYVGIISCNYEALKLFGLLISVLGFKKVVKILKNYSIKAQCRNIYSSINNDVKPKRFQELCEERQTLKEIPPSFIRQMEAIFVNKRSKNVYFILYEIENIYTQLKTQNQDKFFIDWSKLYFERFMPSFHQFSTATSSSIGENNNALNEEENSDDDLMYHHYIFSCCGFEWNSELDCLPHRPFPTTNHFNDTLDDLTSLLNRLHSPIMITISRSSEDGYIEESIVDRVQTGVLKCLESIYENRGLNIIQYHPSNGNFCWPSSRQSRNINKHYSDLSTSFRKNADKVDKKDIR